MLPVMPAACGTLWNSQGWLFSWQKREVWEGLGNVLHTFGAGAHTWGGRNFRWPQVPGSTGPIWSPGGVSVLGSTQIRRSDLQQGWSKAKGNVKRLILPLLKRRLVTPVTKRLKVKLPVHHLGICWWEHTDIDLEGGGKYHYGILASDSPGISFSLAHDGSGSWIYHST